MRAVVGGCFIRPRCCVRLVLRTIFPRNKRHCDVTMGTRVTRERDRNGRKQGSVEKDRLGAITALIAKQDSGLASASGSRNGNVSRRRAIGASAIGGRRGTRRRRRRRSAESPGRTHGGRLARYARRRMARQAVSDSQYRACKWVTIHGVTPRDWSLLGTKCD